jgi:hypothetical protein
VSAKIITAIFLSYYMTGMNMVAFQAPPGLFYQSPFQKNKDRHFMAFCFTQE